MANPQICSIDGCGKAHYAKNWCRKHYQRFRTHGDPLAGKKPAGEAVSFLENTVLPFDGDECLIWPYTRGSGGYGRVWHSGKVRYVHRIVCEAWHGQAPSPEHEAAHLCGKGHEGCVNRKHLVWKTRAENEADKLAHGTHNRGEQHARAKLTETQVLRIRASAVTGAQLAKEYGVSRQLISSIKTRKLWAHL